MATFELDQPGFVYDELNNRLFRWLPEQYAADWHRWTTIDRRGVADWDALMLVGWLPATTLRGGSTMITADEKRAALRTIITEATRLLALARGIGSAEVLLALSQAIDAARSEEDLLDAQQMQIPNDRRN
jgi:hypothetical protein